MSARLLLLSCSLLTAVASTTFAQSSDSDASGVAQTAAMSVRRGEEIRSIELTQLSERGPQKMPLYAPEGEPMIVHFWGSSDSVNECLRELHAMSGIIREVSATEQASGGFDGDNRGVCLGMGVLSNWTIPTELRPNGERPSLVVTTGDRQIVGLDRIKANDRRLCAVAVDAQSGRPSSEFQRLMAQSAAENSRLSIKLNLVELRNPAAPTTTPSEPSSIQQIQSPDCAPK